MNRSFIEHFLIFLKIDFKFLISSVLCIDRSNIFDISDLSVIVLLELILISLDLFT